MIFWHVGSHLEQVASFPPPTLRPATPPADPVARLLYDQELRNASRELLDSFDGQQLADPEYRQDTLRALSLLGADPALIDQIKVLTAP